MKHKKFVKQLQAVGIPRNMATQVAQAHDALIFRELQRVSQEYGGEVQRVEVHTDLPGVVLADVII